MVFKILVKATLVLVISFTVVATPVDTAKIKAALEARIANGTGVGYVVGIIDAGERSFVTAGQARKSTGAVPTADSIFEIGSIAKTFTAVLLADMVVKGEVALDDAAASYLPEGVLLPTRGGKVITLRHLATHTSGLPRMPSNFAPADWANPYADYTVDNMYAFLADHTLTREIGERVEYSNLGMGLLGHVLALKAGVSYEALLRERIFEPLGMDNTSIIISADQRPFLTDGHDTDGKKTSHWDIPTLAGAGGIRSSGNDMMAYMAANMGLLQSTLSPALEMSHKFQRDFGQPGLEIGLAWIKEKSPEGDIVWHNGGTGGYRSYLGVNKEKGLGVLVLANSNDNSDEIARTILRRRGAAPVEAEKAGIKIIRLAANDLKRLVGE